MERIDKLLSQGCNLSRREAKELLRGGRVLLNGMPVRAAEQPVDREADSVTVDGKPLSLRAHVYLMLNKPAGVLSAARDNKQPTVLDLLPVALRRKDLFPAGRLDKDTTGLLLLTNDGDFAHRMLSPRNQIYKRYRMRLEHPVGQTQADALLQGITLADGTACLPAFLLPLDGTYAEIRICEGKFHQVKRMMQALGNTVLELERTQIGALILDSLLPPGACRMLSEQEAGLVFTAI